MRKEIWRILKDLENEKVTTNQAYHLLCDLFDVSSSASSENDITRCPKCKSTDHTMITGQPYKCMDCGHKWV